MGMPIAFLCVDEKYSVVALLGLEPEEEKLLSMQRISELAQFAQAKSKAESTPPSKELNLDGVNMDGNISFENL